MAKYEMSDPVFFAPARILTVGEVATISGARLVNAGFEGVAVSGLASIEDGGEGKLVYADGKRQAEAVKRIRAAAAICTEDLAELVPPQVAVLVSKRPQACFAAVGRLFFPTAVRPAGVTGVPGVSPAAHIAADVELEADVTVEAGAVVGPGAAIGRGTLVAAGAIIGPGCRIGRDCHVGPGASLINALVGDRVIIHPGARIGQDGFGFVAGQKGLEKVPQIGRVVIQDDVEIGACTSIDRGTLSDTVVGEGTKIDNQVQIAHNVRIGRFCAIAAMSGLSGTVTLGDYVMLGGRVGIADHNTIGDGAQIAAGSGVMTDIPAGARWAGAPAQPVRDFFREVAYLRGRAKSRRGDRNG